MRRKVRVLIAKPSNDCHDIGAKVVARALEDVGFDVIFGTNATPEMIAETAIREKVKIVGLSILNGTHLKLIPAVMDELKKRGVVLNKDVVVLVGGAIPPEDIPKLKEIGVTEVFASGTPIQEIIDFVKDVVT